MPYYHIINSIFYQYKAPRVKTGAIRKLGGDGGGSESTSPKYFKPIKTEAGAGSQIPGMRKGLKLLVY
jgi:hypothetical protein